MKRIAYIFIALSFLTSTLTAQTREIDRLFNKYRGEEGIISIWLPGMVMKFAASIADLEKTEENFLRSIKSLRVLTIEDTELYPDVNFTREANINTDPEGYQLLIQVSDSGEDVMILGKERNGKLKDLLVLVGGKDNVIVHIKGRMNADMIGSLGQIAGLDKIDFISQL